MWTRKVLCAAASEKRCKSSCAVRSRAEMDAALGSEPFEPGMCLHHLTIIGDYGIWWALPQSQLWAALGIFWVPVTPKIKLRMWGSVLHQKNTYVQNQYQRERERKPVQDRWGTQLGHVEAVIMVCPARYFFPCPFLLRPCLFVWFCLFRLVCAWLVLLTIVSPISKNNPSKHNIVWSTASWWSRQSDIT